MQTVFAFQTNDLRFASVIITLKERFCSLLSPTYQIDVLYGTPKHKYHSVTGSLMYCKKLIQANFHVHQVWKMERHHLYEVAN